MAFLRECNAASGRLILVASLAYSGNFSSRKGSFSSETRRNPSISQTIPARCNMRKDNEDREKNACFVVLSAFLRDERKMRGGGLYRFPWLLLCWFLNHARQSWSYILLLPSEKKPRDASALPLTEPVAIANQLPCSGRVFLAQATNVHPWVNKE